MAQESLVKAPIGTKQDAWLYRDQGFKQHRGASTPACFARSGSQACTRACASAAAQRSVHQLEARHSPVSERFPDHRHRNAKAYGEHPCCVFLDRRAAPVVYGGFPARGSGVVWKLFGEGLESRSRGLATGAPGEDPELSASRRSARQRPR